MNISKISSGRNPPIDLNAIIAYTAQRERAPGGAQLYLPSIFSKSWWAALDSNQ
jgi:hypothetical protein